MPEAEIKNITYCKNRYNRNIDDIAISAIFTAGDSWYFADISDILDENGACPAGDPMELAIFPCDENGENIDYSTLLFSTEPPEMSEEELLKGIEAFCNAKITERKGKTLWRAGKSPEREIAGHF